MHRPDPAHDQARQASQAERALIGCVLRRPEAMDDAAHVRAQDMREAAHRVVWDCLLAMYQGGEAIDPVTVYDRLVRLCPDKSFPGPGGLPAELLALAAEECTSPAMASHYAGVVRDLSLLRSLADAGREMVREAESPTGPALEALHAAERSVFALAERGHQGAAVPLSEALRAALERIAERIDSPLLAGVPTGLAPLDNLTGGLRPGELVVLAARPSVGKTGLALALAAEAARQGRPALFCSIEMAGADLACRLIASELPASSAVRAAHLRDPGQMGLDAFGEVREAARRLEPLALWIDDSPTQSVLRVSAAARRLRRKGGLSLVVVDYLQLMDPDDRSLPRHEQVAALSRRLKQLARELGAPVLALAQLNREVEARTDRRPKLSDLRESGQVEQDADLVLLLHRHEQAGLPGAPQAPGPVTLCVQVAKNRNGPTGEFLIDFDRERMAFSECVRSPFG